MKKAEKLIRAKEVTPLANHYLLIRFENDEEKLFDCRSLLEESLFAAIRDEDYFRTVHVDDMGLVCWDEATDINLYYLYDESISLKVLHI